MAPCGDGGHLVPPTENDPCGGQHQHPAMQALCDVQVQVAALVTAAVEQVDDPLAYLTEHADLHNLGEYLLEEHGPVRLLLAFSDGGVGFVSRTGPDEQAKLQPTVYAAFGSRLRRADGGGGGHWPGLGGFCCGVRRSGFVSVEGGSCAGG